MSTHSRPNWKTWTATAEVETRSDVARRLLREVAAEVRALGVRSEDAGVVRELFRKHKDQYLTWNWDGPTRRLSVVYGDDGIEHEIRVALKDTPAGCPKCGSEVRREDGSPPRWRCVSCGYIGRADQGTNKEPAPQQRCPVCEGRGHHARGFYLDTPDGEEFTGVGPVVTCRTCNGTGLLPVLA